VAIISSGKTDIGRVRKTNQDSICLMGEQHFFCVADGMGGHSGGDIASQMTINLFTKLINANSENPKVHLEYSLNQINQEIFLRAGREKQLKGMGTTVTALYLVGSEGHIINVGDSRTYLFNKNKLYQLTRDHSLVQEKINMGIYTREAAASDKQKNVLVRSVGIESNLESDVFNYKITRNDLFLLCSDGLHGKVSEEDITQVINNCIPDPALAGQKELDQAVDLLIKQANDNGGNDNISVILVLAK
jgi:protein phosphatase